MGMLKLGKERSVRRRPAANGSGGSASIGRFSATLLIAVAVILTAGAVLISGASHYGGQLEDRAAACMAPLPRLPCRRLQTRCVVLADGRVTRCDQDFNGRHVVGSLTSSSLQDVGQGPALVDLRKAHREQRFALTDICAGCDEWHRV